jgi:5-methylcytosine-specific restriction endonuclease McrBC regulatory subunit McrC
MNKLIAIILLFTLSSVSVFAVTDFYTNSKKIEVSPELSNDLYDGPEFFVRDTQHIFPLFKPKFFKNSVEGLVDTFELEVESMRTERDLGPYAVLSTMNGIEYKLDLTNRNKYKINPRNRTLHLFIGSANEPEERRKSYLKTRLHDFYHDFPITGYDRNKNHNIVAGAMIKIDLFKQ